MTARVPRKALPSTVTEDWELVDKDDLHSHREIMQGKIDLLESKVDAFKELVAAKDKAIDLMSNAYKESLDHRLVEMNNFRQAMEDQSKKNVTEEKFEGAIKNVRAEMDTLATRLEGKTDRNTNDIAELKAANITRAAVRATELAVIARRNLTITMILSAIPIVIAIAALWYAAHTGNSLPAKP